MMKISFLVLLLIYSIKSNANSQDECPKCELDQYFNQSNGYGCTQIDFPFNTTICTCPDQKFTINTPCRICRAGICGPQTAICSEQSTVFGPIHNKPHYACFCSSGLFQIGKSCPEEITTITSPMTETTTTTSIETTRNVTITSTKDTITTTMVVKCEDRSISSHLYIEPILIILLNLVYFVNK